MPRLPACGGRHHQHVRPPDGRNILPFSINPTGTITGHYFNPSSFTNPGFLRKHDGTITSFNVPGADGTFPLSINPAGAITGDYSNPSRSTSHSFQRVRDGTITTFDVPDAIDTNAASINPAGAITGEYTDKHFVTHGFLRIRCERHEDSECERDEAGENN